MEVSIVMILNNIMLREILSQVYNELVLELVNKTLHVSPYHCHFNPFELVLFHAET
jgi:hypothetical protein